MGVEVIVITGPSGVGKDEVAKRVKDRLGDRARKIVTFTSRSPRVGRPGIPDEIDGVDYNFVSRERFEVMIRANAFAEYAVVYGEYKGTAKASLAAPDGKVAVLRIDPTAAAEMAARQDPHIAVAYLGVKDLFTLKSRVQKRESYERQAFNNRLSEDWKVWKEREQIFRTCATVIINEDGKLDETVNQVMALIT